MIGQTMAFPATLADVPTPVLLDAFEAGPSRIRASLVALTPEQFTAHPRSGKWSIAQVVMHLADSEIVGAGRIRLALAEPGRDFVGYDQEVWAGEFRYDDATQGDALRAVATLAALRESTTPVLRSLESAKWDRTGVHPDFGPITVRQLLELYADHTERHLSQILDMRRRLGVPRDAKGLLPRPLY